MSLSKSGHHRSPRAILITLLLGACSAGLFVLLALYADKLPALAAAARDGKTWYALVPLGIAFVFSFVHGAFTGRFWDLLGLRPKK